MLMLLTVMISLNSFGQIYEDDGNRSFSDEYFAVRQ